MRSTKPVQFFVALSLDLAGLPPCALAYRPFDSTDPAVADESEFEIELSPVSFRHDSGDTWISPQLRLNYGFAKNWEVVLEDQGEHLSGANTLEAEVTVEDPPSFIKPVHVQMRSRKAQAPGGITESRCADGESVNPFGQKEVPIPVASRPDF